MSTQSAILYGDVQGYPPCTFLHFYCTMATVIDKLHDISIVNYRLLDLFYQSQGNIHKGYMVDFDRA
jgi:hypothetical protein